MKGKTMLTVDAHVHFYDPTRPQGVPWPRGDDQVIYRKMFPENYRIAAATEDVAGVVVIEASSWLEDNQWILDMAEGETLIWGVIGNLDPAAGEFAENLARFGANPLFRGIRVDMGKIKGSDSQLRAGLQLLAANGLVLEVLTRAQDIPAILRLVEGLPDLRVILNHLAGVQINGNSPDGNWLAQMRMAAQYPHVYCKVSRLLEASTSRPVPRDVKYYAPVLDVVCQLFGEDRLIYGSNWPPCERCAPLATVHRLTRTYFSDRGMDAVYKVFGQNALRVYQLHPRAGDAPVSRTRPEAIPTVTAQVAARRGQALE